jgi:hypothetical protein
MRIFKTTLLALGTFVVLAFASCERDHVKMDTDQELNWSEIQKSINRNSEELFNQGLDPSRFSNQNKSSIDSLIYYSVVIDTASHEVHTDIVISFTYTDEFWRVKPDNVKPTSNIVFEGDFD